MLAKPTVLVLGVGASHPYGYPTGWELLKHARRYPVEAIAAQIKPRPSFEARALYEVLRATGDASIDAVLEEQEDIREAGKAFIARWLLNDERKARDARQRPDPEGAWYRELFGAMRAGSLEEFRRNPLMIVTYNYDRSLDNFLVDALSAKYRKHSREECANALDCIGPWHVHGQLGTLPERPAIGIAPVPYGGDANALTDSNVAEAAAGIKIMDEAHPNNDVLMLARDAISKADRLVFLGFGFNGTNVRRLRLHECLRNETAVFASAKGPARLQDDIRRALNSLTPQIGAPNEGALEFLQRYYQLLEPVPIR
jgi:hypothetical protein